MIQIIFPQAFIVLGKKRYIIKNITNSMNVIYFVNTSKSFH